MKYSGMHKKKAIEGKEIFITNYEPENLQKKTRATSMTENITKAFSLED